MDSVNFIIVACILFIIIVALFYPIISKHLKGKQAISFFPIQSGIHRVKSQGVNKSEEKTRLIFERLFGVKFTKDRPDFLKRSNGRNLELDGYNKEMRLAFEYDGIQHYKFVPYFHRTYDNFIKQQERDREKDQMCRENGITLIRIPYFVTDIENYILDNLKQNLNRK